MCIYSQSTRIQPQCSGAVGIRNQKVYVLCLRCKLAVLELTALLSIHGVYYNCLYCSDCECRLSIVATLYTDGCTHTVNTGNECPDTHTHAHTHTHTCTSVLYTRLWYRLETFLPLESTDRCFCLATFTTTRSGSIYGGDLRCQAERVVCMQWQS